jgi:hypothetical protein
MIRLIDRIHNFSVISIIGLAKNVSKTTTLNYLIKNLKEKYILGLTSIGRDGEEYDVITELPKPRILIEKGMYIVTAESCYQKSKIRMELIKNTGYNTPLGEVLILKSLGKGLIELAGPSINSYLNAICLELKKIGCNLILIDGAFDRKSFATPLISDATILSTGASVSERMEDVIDLTYHTVKLFTLENEKDERTLEIAKKIIKDSKIGIINYDNSIRLLDILTSLDSAREIIRYLDINSKYVVIKGAITDKLLEDLMKFTDKYKDITILAEDATKLFLSMKVIEKFQKKNGNIKVITPIKKADEKSKCLFCEEEPEIVQYKHENKS